MSKLITVVISGSAVDFHRTVGVDYMEQKCYQKMQNNTGNSLEIGTQAKLSLIALYGSVT